VLIRTSYFIAKSAISSTKIVNETRGVFGISAPGSEGLQIANCSFGYFNDLSYTTAVGTIIPAFAIRTCARCGEPQFSELGGFTYVFEGLQWLQSPNRVYYGPPHVDIVVDRDGSLFGRATGSNYTAVPRQQHIYDLPGCVEPPVLAVIMYAGGSPVFICDGSYRFHRLVLASPSPALLTRSNLTVDSSFGAFSVPYRTSVKFPERSGFVFLLPSGTATDELGNRIYDANNLNFTIYSASNNDWSKLSAFLDAVSRLYNGRLVVRFSYYADVVRYDAVPLRFDALGNALPMLKADVVVPTYFADPALIDQAAATTHQFLQTDVHRLTIVFLGTGLQGVDMTRVLCASTGCIKMQPPVVPARSYSWTDVRAWRSGRVPLDGEDAVIPPGQTVLLSGNTSNLRSLVIQGTLELHPRLPSEIVTAYLIVFGGTLRSQIGHTPSAKITLRSDTNTSNFGVEEGRVLRPGTMLVLGAVSLTGTARTKQWVTLSDPAAAKDASLKVTDAVSDWVRQDVIVVSSTLRDATAWDQLIVSEIKESRQIVTVNSLSFPHQSVPIDLATGQRLNLRAEVGLLTRNIVIDPGTRRLGFTIVLAEYGRDLAFAASGTLDSVEVRYGGFVDDVTQPTVVFDGLTRHAVVLSKSSVYSNNGPGVRCIHGAVGVTVSDSVIFKTVGPAIDAGDGDTNLFQRNLAFGTEFPATIRANPALPYALCTFDGRFSVSSWIGNVAAGSASEGFCIQLAPCDSATVEVSDNEAHSNVIGFFVAQTTAPEDPLTDEELAARAENPALTTMGAVTRRCVAMSGSVAWQNSYMGVFSLTNTDVLISNALIHDNHIGLYAGSTGSFITTVTGSVIAGRSKPLQSDACALFRCKMETITGTCSERGEVLGDSPTFLEGEIGLLLSTYMATPRPANYSRTSDLPLTRPKQYEVPSADGAVYMQNIVFATFLYGSELGICSGAKAIATEGFSMNTITPHFFENVTYIDVNELGMVYLHSPAVEWNGAAMCGGEVCNALEHVALRDLDGSLVNSPGKPSVIYSNHFTGALLRCTLVKEWNAFKCLDASYAQLSVMNLDDDNKTRSISPLEIQDERYLARINVAIQPPACYVAPCKPSKVALRPGSITTELRTERIYLIDFNTEVPRRTRWELRNCMASGNAKPRAIVVRVQMPARMDVNIWANGQLVTPSPTSVDFLFPAGSNYFEELDTRMYMVLPCESVIEAHQIVNAIVTMSFAIRIEDYVSTFQDLFIPVVARFLELPEVQVKVVEIYPGSTVVRFRVLASDAADYNPTAQANDVNSRVLRLLTTPIALLAAELGMPVASVDSIEWAEAVARREDPGTFSASLSDEFVIAISVSAAVAVLILLFLLHRVYKSVMQYRELEQEITLEAEDQELQGLTDGPNFDVFSPQEDEANPRVEVGIKSLRIKVDVSTTTTTTKWTRAQRRKR
jgi:hypothetical protein